MYILHFDWFNLVDSTKLKGVYLTKNIFTDKNLDQPVLPFVLLKVCVNSNTFKIYSTYTYTHLT